MAPQTQKPSWLASLLSKETVLRDAVPGPGTAPGTAPEPAPAPETPKPVPAPDNESAYSEQSDRWGSLVAAGKGTLLDDPMSGSIMKLLAENGFRSKIESGMKSGRSFSVIHKAPSTEFLLVESWDDNGSPRKNYQAFSVKSVEKKTDAVQTLQDPHPVLATLRGLEADIDALLHETKRYA